MYDKQNPPVSTSLDLFNEDVYAAMDPAGRIVRRDHFKGFTPAQQRRLRQENEIILQQKKLRDMEEKQAEMIWTKQQVSCISFVVLLYPCNVVTHHIHSTHIDLSYFFVL